MKKMLIAACILALGSAFAAENAHEWPQFKGGPGFTGYSPDDSVKPPFKLLWEFRTDGDGTGDAGGGVLVAEGKVFCLVTMTESVLAIDADTGEFLWETVCKGLFGRLSISYDDGRVFAWSGKNRNVVTALDAKDGKVLWKATLKGKSSIFGRFRNGLAVWDGKLFCVDQGDDPAVVALSTETGEQVWRAPLDAKYGKDVIPPCVAGGRVFAGISVAAKPGSPGATYALDAKTGQEVWRREGISPYISPSSDGEVVMIPMSTKANSKMYMLDAATGKDIWVGPSGASATTPTIIEDMILTKRYGNNFSAYDRKDGKLIWSFYPLNTGCNTPTVSGGYAYFGSGKPHGFKGTKKGSTGGKGFCNEYRLAREAGYGWTLYAIDLKTGKPVWNHSSAFNVCGEPAIAYGRMYAVSGGGHIYCFAPAREGEPTTPEAVDKSPNAPAEEVKKVLARKADIPAGWTMAGGGPERNGREGLTINPPLEPAWTFQTGGRVLAEPAIAGGKVFIGSNDGSIYALDAAGGKPAWEFKTGARVRCAPAVADNTVYCGADNGEFYALDAASGQEKWKFEAGGPVRGDPAVVGGAVIFGANDHNIYALDRATGKKLWSFRTRYYRHHAAPVVHGDTVYALPGMDYVHAIDIATGQEKWKAFCVKTGEGLSYYKGRLWAHGWCAAEIDAEKGGVTRFVSSPPYGYNRIALMNDRIYTAGTGGGQCLDFNDPGNEASLGESNAGRLPSKGKSLKLRGSTRAASPAASPVPLGDKICFVSKAGEITLSDPDGSMIWSAELGATCHASPGVGCGLLVVGDDTGKVHAFREK